MILDILQQPYTMIVNFTCWKLLIIGMIVLPSVEKSLFVDDAMKLC